MKKRLLTYLLTGAMTLSLAAPAAFGNEAGAETEVLQTEAAIPLDPASENVWEPDTRMSLTREMLLRREMGMSLQEWDDAVAQKKREGKENALTQDAILAANPDARILENDGRIYMIESVDALGEVSDALDAYRAAYSAASLLGAGELADLRLWHQMNINDERIYSFQQITDSKMVAGSTMKLVVKGNRVSALFSSLDPEAGGKEDVAREEDVIASVRNALEEQGVSPEILPEYTDRIRYTPSVLADLTLDDPDEEPVQEELRWVVYTVNKDEEYPYLANYTDLAGNYLESLAVEEPAGDEALCGFRKQKVFDGMEAAVWTGELKGLDDNVQTVTLPVMRDQEGHLFLGDVVRRIAVADFAKAVYDENHRLEIVQSDEEGNFDNEDLYMFFNYLNAWDFYADMGWLGPDGEGNDVIILKGLCTSDGTPYENACSIGMVQGWQMFGYTPYSGTGEPLGLGRGLDVMAHEYTHTFTSTIMNSNLYENDPGAINEAMSDILGNLTELILSQTDDTRWVLGENTGMPIRNMSDPVAYQQPAYVWDKFYGPEAETPNDANDQGGVHSNSSLLNYIAAKLCMDAGLSYKDAVCFWTMTAGGLTPETDYPQICSVMRWAMAESGNEAFLDSLDTLIKEVKLEQKELPDKLPAGRKIVHLDLPDTAAFEDENWTLLALQLNMETIGQFAVTAGQILAQAFEDGTDAGKIGRILSDYLDSIHLDGNKIQLEKSDDTDAIVDAITDALVSGSSRLVEQSMAWSGSAGDDITFVTDNSPTIYALLNITKSGTVINGATVLIGKRWVDLSPFLNAANMVRKEMSTTADDAETEAETEPQSILDTVSDLTPEQWETIMEIGSAVKELIRPDQAEDAADKADDNDARIEELLDLGLALLEYATADEEERAEGVLLPAKTQELPTEGLEKTKLLEN